MRYLDSYDNVISLKDRGPVTFVKWKILCIFETYEDPGLTIPSVEKKREYIVKMRGEDFNAIEAKRQAIIRLAKKEVPLCKKMGLYIRLDPESIEVRKISRVNFPASGPTVINPNIEQWETSQDTFNKEGAN
ncbi:MAG TPA: hypothetical protein P5096_04105 [Patescibacteria group bacterium]|nr:hypothetical protein [Patescibacteria group bacterium]